MWIGAEEPSNTDPVDVFVFAVEYMLSDVEEFGRFE